MTSGDDDSDYKTRKTKSGKKKRRKRAATSAATLKKRQYSTVKDKFVCDLCGFESVTKIGIGRHLSGCTGTRKKRRKTSEDLLHCRWCNVKFKNRGNLTTHIRHVHGDCSFESTVGQQQPELEGAVSYKCPCCYQSFIHNFQLTYHIRRMHYNMVAKMPYAMLKKVNQVWFEKVLNSNIIMEIKKTGQNKLLMKKLDENTSIKVNNDFNDVIDVTHLYPTGNRDRKIKVKCPLCDQWRLRRDLRKHISERHHKSIKYRCNNCNRGFKRLYIYLKHVCRATRLNGVQMTGRETDIQIASVESLAIPI